MGIMYYYGKGVEKNHLFAYAWLTQALGGGFKEAQDGLDFLEKSLTPEELVKAKKLAEKFKEKLSRRGKGKK
jgi:enhanced entry protein LpnE